MQPKDYSQLLYEVLENKPAAEQDKILHNFKNILIRNRETCLAPSIEKEFVRIEWQKEQGKITYISSASRFTASQEKELEKISSEPREFSVNPELLGGVAVRKGDKLYNATLRKKVETLITFV